MLMKKDLIIDPLYGPPDSHLRAARKVTGAVFGKERFRGSVEIDEPSQDTTVYLATHNDETGDFLTKDDALLWIGIRHGQEPEVEEVPLVDILDENPNLTKKEYVKYLQDMSITLKTVTKSLYSRIRAWESATKDIQGIEQVGFEIDRITKPYSDNLRKMARILRKIETDSGSVNGESN